MILVVGSTGAVGLTVCRLLSSAGYEVRALVRGTSDLDSIDELGLLGADITIGDLKDSNSLRAVCDGVSTVISTASSTMSQQEGDSIASVDRNGQLDLMSVAAESGVDHAIFVSFHDMAEQFPLKDAKRAVETQLRRGRMSYTILQPTFFMEVWLGPHLGFNARNARARVYGSGKNRVPWISQVDVWLSGGYKPQNVVSACKYVAEQEGWEYFQPASILKAFGKQETKPKEQPVKRY